MALFHLAKKITNEILVRHTHFRKVYGNNLLNFSSILFFFPFWQWKLGKFSWCSGIVWENSKVLKIELATCLILRNSIPLFASFQVSGSNMRFFLPVHTSERGLCNLFLLKLVILQWKRFLWRPVKSWQWVAEENHKTIPNLHIKP